MYRLTVWLLLVGMTTLAQVKGNGDIVTKTINVEGLTDLEMGLYANVIVDQSTAPQMIITVDSNLQELIDTEIADGTLKLSQLEWIQPSQRIEITIGAPILERLEMSVNQTVFLKNVDQKTIALMALNGKIVASGIANSAGLGAENGTIDASGLEIKEAQVNIWGNGRAIVNASDFVESKLSKNARLDFVKEPAKVKGDRNQIDDRTKSAFAKAQYIDIKIKNNSWNRKHFAVKGPKRDGSYFGYGFPMMPGAVKKERWTVGTKIYKVNKLGIRTLLKKIELKDKDQIINLF